MLTGYVNIMIFHINKKRFFTKHYHEYQCSAQILFTHQGYPMICNINGIILSTVI